MFEALSEKLKKTFRDLRGMGKVSEAHIETAVREIRMALLEADVNYQVVKSFVERIREKALGQEVFASLTPAQQVIKVVNDELVEMLGGASSRLVFTTRIPNVVMIAGLQGSGKTTTAAKLAHYLSKQEGKNPLLVSADVYRPAAREQLSILGKSLNRAVFEMSGSNDPLEICRQAHKHAQQVGFDVLLVDTAGRLHIDDELMGELAALKRDLQPMEILFVADAMTGQDAVRSATEFHQRIGLTGVVLTKLDGDARGGAALSIKAVTGQPVKFTGVGEKLDALEVFHPDRIASRILGMGDVLSLIEKVQAEVDEKEAQQLQQKLAQDSFTLEDYRNQLGQMRKLGSLEKLMGMLPDQLLGGMNFKLSAEQAEQLEKKLKRTEAIIDSMTIYERNHHQVIDGSRRKRIARGSGTQVHEINALLKEYVEMRRVMKMVAGGGMMGGLGRMMRKGKRKKVKRRRR